MNRFLCEDNGSPSMMRLITVLLVVASVVFGLWSIAADSAIAQELAISFLSVAVMGKFAQKAVEQKNTGLSPQDIDDGK